MTGYWDIHNHILPGVDDGSGCMRETMEMLEEEYRQGVRHIVFTPHYRRDMFAIPREEIQTVYARVCEMAADRFPEMEFYLGCEYYIHSDASVERLRGNPKYYMAGSRTVLMEFAYEASYAWIMQTVSEVRQMGLQPVLAHAERYECLYKGRDRVATVVMQEDGTWVYINEDGVADESYCGFVSYGGSWWEIRNGVIDFSVNSVDEGIVNGEYGWWNVVNGRVDMGNTVAQNAGGWWCIRNGKVDFSYTGVAQNAGGWWRIENGMVNFAYNGVVNSEYGWWFIRNGSIDFTYTGLAQNEYGWWRIVNGTIDFGCNSVVDSEYGWWYVRNGQVDFGYTGVAQNEYGWWRIENGALNFGFTGLAQNEYGWWYIRSGMLDFSYTGYVNWYGTAYRVQNGQVIF